MLSVKNSERKFGIQALSPPIRTGLVIVVGILYIFIHDVLQALGMLLIGGLAYLLTNKKSFKVALAAIIPGLLMFVYNFALSPEGSNYFEWWFFNFNQQGLEWGAITGMRLVGVMLLSYAWLSTTSFIDMYKSFAWIESIEYWAMSTVRELQLVKKEFISLTHSLLIRGFRWNSIVANIKNLVPLGTAIIPRILDGAQKSTYAGATHKPNPGRAKTNGRISLNNFHVKYQLDQPDVLQIDNLEIKSGEVVFIAGKSRSGKTTLLRALSGYIPRVVGAAKGCINVAGLDVLSVDLEKLAQRVIMVSSDPLSSIFGLTVGQEIMLITNNEAKARSALSVMGIENLWEQETVTLSGGQQIRLVLAGALVSQADIILLDTPTQELDPHGRTAFLDALNKLRRERPKCTIVITDPFWHEVKDFVERVVVLNNGRVITNNLQPSEFENSKWFTKCGLSNKKHFLNLNQNNNEIAASMTDVHVYLGEKHILKGFDFEVKKGELVAVIGKNGSGKTTAMLTLAGAIAVESGNLHRNGNLRYVFQHPSLQTVEMMVDKEVSLGPRLNDKYNLYEQEIKKAIEWTNLNPKDCPLDLHPADKRILMIAASKVDAEVIILDEPTIDLDAFDTQKVLDLIQNLLTQQTAVVVITHDPRVMNIANRVAVVNNGKVVETYKP